MNTSQWPAWPVYDEEQISAVTRVLESGRVNYWTGREGQRFEEEFASAVGVRYGVALANGSVALEVALRACGLEAGDEVVVPARSFVATAGAVLLAGGRPVFADVDPNSQNLTAETLSEALTPRSKAVIPVHHGGWPCDMRAVMSLAEDRGLWVIEDCAQAHGARIWGRPVGAWGHMAAFSFCQDKILTTGGEGGMLTTNLRELWERAWSWKDHGKSRSKVFHGHHAPGYRFVHENAGTNLRLTEMQAAIGRVQLERLPEWLRQRRWLGRELARVLQGRPGIRVPVPGEGEEHAFYRFYCFVDTDRDSEATRDWLLAALQAEGIPARSGTCPEIYRERAFHSHAPKRRLPCASRLGETSLMLPINPYMGEMELAHIEEAMDKRWG